MQMKNGWLVEFENLREPFCCVPVYIGGVFENFDGYIGEVEKTTNIFGRLLQKTQNAFPTSLLELKRQLPRECFGSSNSEGLHSEDRDYRWHSRLRASRTLNTNARGGPGAHKEGGHFGPPVARFGSFMFDIISAQQSL